MELKKAFGLHLKHSRAQMKISQEELAFRADVHRTYISLLERGIRAPSLTVIFRISEALEKKPEDFICNVRKIAENK